MKSKGEERARLMPRGPRPRPARLESRREGPRAVTGLPSSGGGDAAGRRTVTDPMLASAGPSDIGHMTDFGDSGAEDHR